MIIRMLRNYRYMREHRWTHAHLSDYLDEELDPEAKERVEEHASICPQCRRVLATLRRTLHGLRDLRPEPEEAIAEGIIARLGEYEGR